MEWKRFAWHPFLCGSLLLHLTLAIAGVLERSRGKSGFLETNIRQKESLMSGRGDDEFDYTIKLTLTLPDTRTHSRLVVLSGLHNELVQRRAFITCRGSNFSPSMGSKENIQDDRCGSGPLVTSMSKLSSQSRG